MQRAYSGQLKLFYQVSLMAILFNRGSTHIPLRWRIQTPLYAQVGRFNAFAEIIVRKSPIPATVHKWKQEQFADWLNLKPPKTKIKRFCLNLGCPFRLKRWTKFAHSYRINYHWILFMKNIPFPEQTQPSGLGTKTRIYLLW